MTGITPASGYTRADRTERRFTVRTRLAVLATCAVAALSTLAARPVIGPVQHWDNLLVLTLVAFVTAVPPRASTRRKIYLSLMGILVLAAIPLGAGAGIGLLPVAAGLARLRSGDSLRVVFNVAMGTTIGVAAAVAYAVVAALSPLTPAGSENADLLLVALALLAADLAQLVVNAAFMAGIIWASRGEAVRAQFLTLVRSGSATYLASGVLALLIYVVWVPAGGGPLSILLLVPSLIATDWALTAEREVERAQFQAVEAISAALESRHPGSAARSREVERVAEVLAEELALAPTEATRVALAGALVGLSELALPPEPDGPERHPARAFTTVDFLEPVVPLLDGQETTGRVREIVAVADRYARERLARPDSPDADVAAFQVVAEGVPEQFDATVVAALGRMVSRQAPTSHQVVSADSRP